MDNRNGIFIHGLDAIDIVQLIQKKKAKFIAVVLSDLENEINSADFSKVRKAVLDGFNDYTRSLIRVLLGEIEEETKYDKSSQTNRESSEQTGNPERAG